MVEILYARTLEEALEARDKGFEPVECSFGREGSAMGPHMLDHHGKYSNLEAVSIKAAKLAEKGVKLNKFVVTGAADCDQVYAIAALSGPQIPIKMEEAEAIAEIDTDPIGRDITSDRYLKILLFNQRTQNLPNNLESTLYSLDKLIEIYNDKFTQKDIEEAIQKEHERKRMVKQGIQELVPGKVALAKSDAWGFDVWYEEAPIVVAYVQSKDAITIGVCPKKGGTLGDVSGLELLGEEGLKKVYPILDKEIKQGWGGRETIGGSPRNVKMTYQDALKAYTIIKNLVDSNQ